jgi:hypothetical protein
MPFKARAYRRGKLRVPEVRLALGPTAEAVTLEGAFADLYGTPWALALEPSGVLHLLRLDAGGEWLEVPSLEPLPVLSRSARHIALAWDGSARPVIAWELEGAVFVRRFDSFTGAYIISNVPGVDPCLWSDALALETTTDSDVILFHLDVTRTQAFSRIQRETFAVPRVAGELGARCDLDAAVTANHGVQLVLASRAGAFALQSPPYPVRHRDSMTGGSSVQSGALQLTTLFHASSDDAQGGSSVLSGALNDITVFRAVEDTAFGGSSVLSGALLLVTTPHASSDDAHGGSSVLSGAFRLVTSNVTNANAVTGGSSVLEGSFE